MLVVILLVLASYLYKKNKPSAKHVELAANTLFKGVLVASALLWCISSTIEAQVEGYASKRALYSDLTEIVAGDLGDLAHVAPELLQEYADAVECGAHWESMQEWVADSWLLLAIL